MPQSPGRHDGAQRMVGMGGQAAHFGRVVPQNANFESYVT